MSMCEEIKERLCEFLDGELPQADRAVVESHLQSCSACRKELSVLREAASAVRTMDRHPAPASILAGVRAGLRQPRAPAARPEVVRPEASFWFRRALSVAAVLIVAVLIYLAYTPQEREQHALAPARPAVTGGAKTAEPADAKRVAPVITSEAAPAPTASKANVSAPVEDRFDPPKSLAKAESDKFLLNKAKTRDEAAGVRAKQGELAFEAKPAAAQPFDIAEKRPMEEQAEPADDGREGDAFPRSATTPVATVRQEAKKGPSVQGDRENVDHLKDLEVADTQQQEVPAPARIEPKAPTKPTGGVAAKGSGSPNRGATQDGQVATVEKESQTPLIQKPASTLTEGRKVLTVPAKDLNIVLEDLRRLAAASGGELAWQPSRSRLADRKKDLARRAQAKEVVEPLGTERAVIRVPQARLEELLRAAEQYRARLLLNTEKDMEAPAEQGAQQADKMDAAAGGEFIQVVLDILPQAVPAAVEAVRTDQEAPAESNRERPQH